MTTLQTRLAQADKPSRELLEEVFRACFPEPSKGRWWAFCPPTEWIMWARRERRFTTRLDAEAWTSAVEMLVPADAWFRLERGKNGECWARVNGLLEEASHPALALAIACLKARGLA